MGRAAPQRGGVRLFDEARDSLKRRTPLRLGLQTALNVVCIGSHTHFHQPTPTFKFDSGGQSGGKGVAGVHLEGCVSGCCLRGKGMGVV